MTAITLNVQLAVADASSLSKTGSGTQPDPFRISIPATGDSTYIQYVASPATYNVKGNDVTVVDNSTTPATLNLPDNGRITFNIVDAIGSATEVNWNSWNPSLSAANSELTPGNPAPSAGQESWSVLARKVASQDSENLTMYSNALYDGNYYVIGWDPIIRVRGGHG